MTARASFEIQGLDRLQARLQAIGQRAPRILAQALYEEAELIMALSKEEYVPVDLGNLRASGHVKKPVVTATSVEVVLAYGGPAAPYALAVHENIRSGKTGGQSPSGRPYKSWAKVGGWKYLEIPVSQAMPGLVARMGLAMREILEA